MAFGWAGAAAGAQGAVRQQQQDAFDLEKQLAEIAYRQAQIEQSKAQDARLREQFAWQQKQAEQQASEKRNQQGLLMMAGDIAEQYPNEPRKMVGTLIRAGVNVPASLLEGPQGAEPFTLGPGQKRFGPDGTVIAEGAQPTADTPDAFTLSPGQVRYGADGKVLAQGPPPRAGAGAQPRRVLSGDVNRIADLDTSLQDLNVLEKEIGTTGAASRIGAMVPNVVSEMTGFGADAKARQGTIDRVKQVIGKALEGGVLRKEDEYKYTKILPTIGDPPSVAQAKLRGLRAAIQQRRATMLDALEDAEFNVQNFRERESAVPPSESEEEWVRDPQTGKLRRAR